MQAVVVELSSPCIFKFIGDLFIILLRFLDDVTPWVDGARRSEVIRLKFHLLSLPLVVEFVLFLNHSKQFMFNSFQYVLDWFFVSLMLAMHRCPFPKLHMCNFITYNLFRLYLLFYDSSKMLLSCGYGLLLLSRYLNHVTIIGVNGPILVIFILIY